MHNKIDVLNCNRSLGGFMLKCEDCGKVSEEVEKGVCPYAEEVYDEKEECQLCPDCYHERCMDI